MIKNIVASTRQGLIVFVIQGVVSEKNHDFNLLKRPHFGVKYVVSSRRWSFEQVVFRTGLTCQSNLLKPTYFGIFFVFRDHGLISG